MYSLNVYVGESPIHGRGLFARRTIKKGEIIGVIEPVPADEDGPYVLWISDERAVEVTCDLRYINHSDTPNACYYDTLEVAAIADIAAGEEITHDYGGGEGEVTF